MEAGLHAYNNMDTQSLELPSTMNCPTYQSISQHIHVFGLLLHVPSAHQVVWWASSMRHMDSSIASVWLLLSCVRSLQHTSPRSYAAERDRLAGHAAVFPTSLVWILLEYYPQWELWWREDKAHHTDRYKSSVITAWTHSMYIIITCTVRQLQSKYI